MEFLDTNNKKTLEEFKQNVHNLMAEVRQKGKIDRFALVRQDDYLPLNWQWESSSMYSQLEEMYTFLSKPLRDAIIEEKVEEKHRAKWEQEKKKRANQKKSFLSLIFKSEPQYYSLPASPGEKDELETEIDHNIANTLIPARFRLTKHFTLNAPLANTARYNQTVSIHRNFNIIDDATTFFDNPYVFAVSYQDCYLDTVHEPLKISDQAVVLIPKDKYEKIIEDKQIAEQLSKRKVIVFSGDEATAINIVLARLGYLPVYINRNLIEFDCQFVKILDQSLKDLCDQKNIPQFVEHEHHFSMQVSEEFKELEIQERAFYEFLKNKFPEVESEIPPKTFVINETSRNCADRMIQKLGTKRILDAINEYNELQKKNLLKKVQTIQYQKDTEDSNILEYYRKLAQLIKRKLSSIQKEKMDPDIIALLKQFYAMGDKDKNIAAGQQLEELLSEKKASR